MKKKDFWIGLEFYTATGKWRCTDIGTRVIVAIKLDQDDPRNYNGPPYSIVEHVFDEYDIEGCSLSPEDFRDDSDETLRNNDNTSLAFDFDDIIGLAFFWGGGFIGYKLIDWIGIKWKYSWVLRVIYVVFGMAAGSGILTVLESWFDMLKGRSEDKPIKVILFTIYFLISCMILVLPLVGIKIFIFIFCIWCFSHYLWSLLSKI